MEQDTETICATLLSEMVYKVASEGGDRLAAEMNMELKLLRAFELGKLPSDGEALHKFLRAMATILKRSRGFAQRLCKIRAGQAVASMLVRVAGRRWE